MIIENEEELTQCHWEIVIVGTGMGGATLGYILAKAGIKVLFLEKGYRKDHPQTIFGEMTADRLAHYKKQGYTDKQIKGKSGVWTDNIHSDDVNVILGCGTGGTSALYGMAMERFHPNDFSGEGFSNTAGLQNQNIAWPVSYQEMYPYYIRAEKLYQVRGTVCPLTGQESDSHFLSPEPLDPGNQELFSYFQSRGLHPFHLHLATGSEASCKQCQGYLCTKDCKNDAEKVCLRPAINDHGAHLITGCEVLKVHAGVSTVDSLEMRWNNKTYVIRASAFVLAAGSITSPLILMNSKSPQWPRGVGNHSGLIGKNLMLHCVDLYTMNTNVDGAQTGSLKQIAFNDFYYHDNSRLGTFQSYGHYPFEKPNALAFAAIMEDAPSTLNKVSLIEDDQQKLAGNIKYKIQSSDLERLALFRKKIADALRPHNPQLFLKAENVLNTSHACGTCRFGDDPQTSVLDSNNQVHGLDNLFVVDASFFPTSGGTNPSLTIAANAIRVADKMRSRLKLPPTTVLANAAAKNLCMEVAVPSGADALLSSFINSGKNITQTRAETKDPLQPKILGVALVGLGFYSEHLLLPSLKETSHCHLAAIVTNSHTKAQEWKLKYDIPEKNIYNYENFELIKNNPEVDIVYIVLPNAMHEEYGVRAANAGKHVIIEKPLEISADKCKKLIKACRENNRMLAVGYRLHFEPHHIQLMKLGAEKTYGKPKKITADFGFKIGEEQWRLDKKISGGGALMDVGIYCIQAACYVTGEEPIAVSAVFGKKTDPEKFREVEESVSFKLEFPGGAIAECRASYSQHMDMLKVETEKGWYGLSPAFNFWGIKGRTSGGQMNHPTVNQQAKLLDHFSLCILNNKRSIVPGEMGLRDVYIMDAIYKAAETGTKVEIITSAAALVEK